jgi:DNA-binding transcriptional ArsR family regulator
MVTLGSVDAVFKALSDPTRRAILESLREGPQSVAVIAAAFPEMSRPAVSKHLRILREAGLLYQEQQGRHRFHRFVTGTLEESGRWLDDFRSGQEGGQKRGSRAHDPGTTESSKASGEESAVSDRTRLKSSRDDGWQAW